jgi:glyoxylase-like metal-dependent hydrolase (beta-lactamase superfamily II)
MNEIILLNLGFTNVYLIKGDTGYIQFDTGWKFDVKKYLRLLEKKKIALEEIKLIVVNHAHFDHVGALRSIKEMTQAKVLVHEKDSEFLIKGISEEVRPLNLFTKIFLKTLPKSWTLYDSVEPDIVIQDEYSLADFGVNGKVIHTPGHTHGTLSIIIEEGDAIIGCLAHGFPLRLRPGFPRIALDEEAIWSSWQKIVDEGAKRIYISHGKSPSIKYMKKRLLKKTNYHQ